MSYEAFRDHVLLLWLSGASLDEAVADVERLEGCDLRASIALIYALAERGLQPA